MNNWVELVKALVRPFLIVWGWVIWGICIALGEEIPVLFTGTLTAITLEYIGERVKKRFKEK